MSKIARIGRKSRRKFRVTAKVVSREVFGAERCYDLCPNMGPDTLKYYVRLAGKSARGAALLREIAEHGNKLADSGEFVREIRLRWTEKDLSQPGTEEIATWYARRI
jgi:hypothetical protein